MENKQILYKPNPSKGVFLGLFGALLILPGLMLMMQDNLIGLILIMIYIVYASMRQGYMIDFKKGQLKIFNKVLFFKIGKWISIEKYNKYRVRSHMDSYRLNSRGNSANYNEKNYTIELIDKKQNNSIIQLTSKKKDIKRLMINLDNNGMIRLQ